MQGGNGWAWMGQRCNGELVAYMEQIGKQRATDRVVCKEQRIGKHGAVDRQAWNKQMWLKASLER